MHQLRRKLALKHLPVSKKKKTAAVEQKKVLLKNHGKHSAFKRFTSFIQGLRNSLCPGLLRYFPKD